MTVIVAGPDPKRIGEALAEAGAAVVRLDGLITADALDDAGLREADVFVLTDPAEATAIPLARELRPDLRIVVYAEEAIPPFATHLADLIIDPAAIDQAVVVEEILETAGGT